MVSLLVALALASVQLSPQPAIGRPVKGRTVAAVYDASNTTTLVTPLSDRFCVSATVTPGAGTWSDATYRAIISQGANLSGVATNGAGFSAHGGIVDFIVNPVSGTSTSVAVTTGWTASTTYRITGCSGPGGLVVCRSGVVVGTNQPPRALTDASTVTWKLGQAVSGMPAWGGVITNFRACKGATRCTDCL